MVGAEDGEASPTQQKDFVDKHTRLQYGRSPRWASRRVASAERAGESGKARGQEWSSAGNPLPTHQKDLADRQGQARVTAGQTIAEIGCWRRRWNQVFSCGGARRCRAPQKGSARPDKVEQPRECQGIPEMRMRALS